PGPSSGRWYEINQSPAWHGLTISALDTPNLTGTEPAIPELVSQVSIDDLAREYGAGSPTYRSAVLAAFAEEAEEQLCHRAWCEQAIAAWQSQAFEPLTRGVPLTFALDIARFGADHSALAVLQG